MRSSSCLVIGWIGAILAQPLAGQCIDGWMPGPSLDQPLDAMTLFEHEVVGGVEGPGEGRPGVMRWDGRGWTALGIGSEGHSILDFAVFRGSLYAGGDDLLRLDGEYWNRASHTYVFALCSYQDELIVGNHGIAAWDGSAWRQLGPGLDGDIYAMTVYRDELIVGGGFQRAFDGQPLGYIAAWNGSTWRPLGGGMDFWVNSLAVHNDRLFAGGLFAYADGQFTGGIAQWDGDSWSAVGDDFQNGAVFELTTFRGELIAAGNAYSDDSTRVRGLGRWDGNSWHTIDGGIPEYSIFLGTGSILGTEDTLFVSGNFTTVGERLSPYWARWGLYLPGDINRDGRVNLVDLVSMLQGFGMPVDATLNDGDTDMDGDVDVQDLANLLAGFDLECP